MERFILDSVGAGLSLSGSIVSIIGAIYNNLAHKHDEAMDIWFFSNAILTTWAFGNWQCWWDGGVSGGFLFFNYTIFSISNFYGLVKRKMCQYRKRHKWMETL